MKSDCSLFASHEDLHQISCQTKKTSSSYAEQSFLPYLKTQLHHANVSALCEMNMSRIAKKPLPDLTGEPVSEGASPQTISFHVTGRTWEEFLRVDENKMEPFRLLSDCIASLDV